MLDSGSLLWKYAADVRSLLPGTAAGVMQLMYPQLGAGVVEHSDFFDAPFERINRSVPQIWATIFQPDALRRGQHIRDLHKCIGGVDAHGQRYHALQPETFWWAHATFTWEIFRAVQFFHAEALSPEQLEQLYSETVEWHERYGVNARPVPADYATFQAKFRYICSEVLELTPSATRALEIAARGSSAVNLLPGAPELFGRAAGVVLAPPLRVLLYGCMPEVVRDRFGIPWSVVDSVRFAALATSIAQGARFVPSGLNHWCMRKTLRVVGARTRCARFQPAAGDRH